MIKPGTKIVLTVGCVAYDLTIDGKNFTEVSEADLRESVRALVEIADGILLQDFLFSAACQMGRCESYDRCPQCGDDVETYTIEL